MSRQTIELNHAIRFLTIGRYSGHLCLALALLASVPLLMTYPMMAAGLNFVDAQFSAPLPPYQPVVSHPMTSACKGMAAGPSKWAMTLLCLTGSISLALHYNACRKGPRLLYQDLQLRALLVIALLLLCLTANGMAWSEAVHHGPLLALSAQTTTGFSTLNPGSLDNASKGILICSMVIGGGIGSTAGGFKILRLLILVRLLHVTIVRTCLPPHAVLEPYLGKRAEV